MAGAENGREALSKAAGEMPDLIVMDMNMPVMTGWEAAHESGCDTFVEKPIAAERLFKAVERVLG